jgi:hypothetical protein
MGVFAPIAGAAPTSTQGSEKEVMAKNVLLMQGCYSFREIRGSFLYLFFVPNLVATYHLEPLAKVQRAKTRMRHVIFSQVFFRRSLA